jgi:peptidoglycan-N-acetylglucosamine deacetylase
MRVEPSILLHPLDFMGVEDKTGLEFFPAMRTSYKPKCDLMDWMFAKLQKHFTVLPMGEHAAKIKLRKLKSVQPTAIEIQREPALAT